MGLLQNPPSQSHQRTEQRDKQQKLNSMKDMGDKQNTQ